MARHTTARMQQQAEATTNEFLARDASVLARDLAEAARQQLPGAAPAAAAAPEGEARAAVPPPGSQGAKTRAAVPSPFAPPDSAAEEACLLG